MRYCSGIKTLGEIYNEEKKCYSMMKEVIASFLASPQGMEMVQTYISSREGKAAIGKYVKTPRGRKMAIEILPVVLDNLGLPGDVKKNSHGNPEKRMKIPPSCFPYKNQSSSSASLPVMPVLIPRPNAERFASLTIPLRISSVSTMDGPRDGRTFAAG
jgi:hypothetical protein